MKTPGKSISRRIFAHTPSPRPTREQQSGLPLQHVTFADASPSLPMYSLCRSGAVTEALRQRSWTKLTGAKRT